eukprot:2517229-Pyramimonas_sp.AAC.1
MPNGRPRRARRIESPASTRCGASAVSERDMLHAVLMVNADEQIAARPDDDTFEATPLSPQQPPTYDEYPSAWISQKYPIAEEGARGYMNVFKLLTRDERVLEQRRRKGTRGTTRSDVPGKAG